MSGPMEENVRMIRATLGSQARRATIGIALIATCLIHVPDAGAGKPGSSAPTTLTGAGSYVETELFDSLAIQDAVNATLTDYEVDRVVLLGGYTSIALNGVGALLVEFEAYDADDRTEFSDGNSDVTQVFSGIATYGDPTSTSGTLDVQVLGRTYWADGASDLSLGDAYPEQVRGVRVQGIDLAPVTAGGLQQDDVMSLQWVYDEIEARGELQVVRLARSVSDTDEILMDWPASTFGGQGQIGVDASGRVYVGSAMLADHYVEDADGNRTYVSKLFRLEEFAGSWDAEDLTPLVGMQAQAPLGVGTDGTVYTVAPDFGDNDAEIWQFDPVTDVWAHYADFDQRCCIREFRALAVDVDGALFAALGARRQSGDYIAEVLPGDLVNYSDRIAVTTARGVRGLLADSGGTLFCAHEERDPNSGTITHTAIYRLDVDTSGGGDAGGGGGKGGGKGKNK